MPSSNVQYVNKIDPTKPYQFDRKSTIFYGSVAKTRPILDGPRSSLTASGNRVNADLTPPNYVSGVIIGN